MKLTRVLLIALFGVSLPAMILLRHLRGNLAAFVAMGVYALLVFGIRRWVAARENERIDAAVDAMNASPAIGQAALSELDPDEQAVVRLRRGDTAPGYEQPENVQVRTFGYPRMPRLAYAALLVAGAGLSLAPIYALVSGNIRSDQRGWAALVAVIFVAITASMPVFRRLERAQVRIGAFGIVATSGFGKSTSIAWADVGVVEEIAFPRSIQISSSDGRRRIRVYPTLVHLPQFVEMLAAELRRAAPSDPRAEPPWGAH